jgi:uncharacterized protein (TIGR02271 family)
MTTRQQMVVAVFDERAQAEQAVNALQNAGINPEQIRFAGQGTSSGGMLDKIKSVFTGQETGTIYNDLVDMGVPQDDASYYQREYEVGHSIVAVPAAGRMQEVTDILARYGGYGANRRFAQTTDTTSTASTGVRETGTEGVQETATEGEQRVRLREEQLRAQKQPVETGEARLRKDVVSEQQSMDVPVTHEEVYVERRPGSGQPTDQPIGEGETYRVPVRDEQVSVEKQAVEREEVGMGKRPVEETKRVSDTVRREEAHVEREGDVGIQGTEGDTTSG